MPVKPNHQKLLVTNKNKKDEPYATDMRTIEQWANEGIVRSLHAGSGITLDPSDGIDDGQGITINSTGGGGGTSVGYVSMFMGPDDALVSNQTVWFGIGGNNEGGPTVDLQSFIPVFSNATGSVVYIAFGSGWTSKVGPGESAALLPEFVAPAFTGGPINISAEISASNVDWRQFAIYQAAGVNYTSMEDYQFQDTDFTGITFGGDLVMTAGSGQNGVGLVNTSGAALVCWAGISGYITIPDGTTFT